MTPRFIAVSCLEEIIHHQHKANTVIDRYFKIHQLSETDRRFVFELVYGVLRRYFSLKADVFRFIHKPPPEFVQFALLVGACQIRYMRVPAYSAVDEMVSVVKQSPHHFAASMVNAVLRRICRTEPVNNLKPDEQCELPLWMYTAWRKSWGAKAVEKFSRTSQNIPALCLAFLGREKSSWLQKLDEQHIEVTDGTLSPRAVILSARTNVQALPGYTAGHFIVMDQSAQLAVEALAVQPGQHVLDMCAAPGGKASLMSMQTGSSGSVTAVDTNLSRIKIMRENIQRLGLANVKVLQMDARELFREGEGFDAVLLDAPCSASGLFRRHPDAKFLHKKKSLAKHASLQASLLEHAIDLVKADGRIVYAVCSIHVEENEKVVVPLLSKQRLIADTLPDMLQPFETDAGMARLFPGEGHDGFFIACLRKTG